MRKNAGRTCVSLGFKPAIMFALMGCGLYWQPVILMVNKLSSSSSCSRYVDHISSKAQSSGNIHLFFTFCLFTLSSDSGHER